jgi:NAD(P)H dehydrogenase (quinone)
MEDKKKQNKKKVVILFYSMYGHVEKLARSILEGVNKVEGVEGELWRVEETLHEDVLKKMYAPPKSEDIPVLTYDKLDVIANADGVLFGFPTRFGMMCAQMKAFWDMTGGLWQKGALVGKPAGFFFSTGGQGGGQETTALTAVTQLAHHGMVYVPIGYTFGPEGFTLNEVKGGSAYGSGTLSAGDGSRQPSDLELRIAKHQGDYFAKFVNKLK